MMRYSLQTYSCITKILCSFCLSHSSAMQVDLDQWSQQAETAVKAAIEPPLIEKLHTQHIKTRGSSRPPKWHKDPKVTRRKGIELRKARCS